MLALAPFLQYEYSVDFLSIALRRSGIGDCALIIIITWRRPAGPRWIVGIIQFKQLNFTFATFTNCFKPSNSHYRYQVKLSRDIGKPSYSSKYVNTT